MTPLISRPLKIERFQDPRAFFAFVRNRSHLAVPEDVIDSVVKRFLILFAECLNPVLRKEFLDRFGEEIGKEVSLEAEKKEYTPEEIIQKLTSVPGSSPPIADDLYGVALEALWYLFPESEIEDFILSLPVQLALDLRAGRPGDKRGSF